MVVGLLLTAGATYKLWYHYPEAEVSFFLSGKGDAEVQFLYSDIHDNKYTDYSYVQLSAEPQLVDKQLRAAKVSDLRVKINKYTGTLHLGDVFVNNKLYTGLQIEPSEGLNILNQSANNISVIMQNPTTYKVCDECYAATLEKVFYDRILALIIGLYAALCLLLLTLYAKREKYKEKLLNLYTVKNYALILPYAKPYWFRALLAVLITAPVGAMDAVIAWSLKPFMDVVLVEKQTGWTMCIPLLIIISA